MEIGAITGGLSLPQRPESAGTEANKGLFNKIWESVQGLSDQQEGAQNQMQAVISGKSDDAQGAMIALEKAELAMSLAVTIRDKGLQGFQEIMRMQL